jgi:hypothetical protein
MSYDRARGAAYRASHKEKTKAYNAAYRAVNRESLNAYSATYYLSHKEEAKTYGVEYRAMLGSLEMVIVAQACGDDTPRCRADLSPRLFDVPCRGALQIDHINGGGRKEHRGKRVRGVINGQRGLDDLRILCELHQWYYAILRKDSPGGSDPKEWDDDDR